MKIRAASSASGRRPSVLSRLHDRKESHGSPPRGLLDVGREVRDLLHLAYFDDVAVLHGRALRPFDRFGPGLHLDHPVAAEHLLRLGARAVRYLGLAAGETYAGARRGWAQP